MVSKINKKAMRMHRHVRVRGKISGTPERPRLNVFRSNANIYAQIIDDVNGVTLVSANTLEKSFEGAAGNCEAAKKVGAVLAERAKEKGHRGGRFRPRRLCVPWPYRCSGRWRP